ncbi:histone methylation protein DOT1 [Actinocorallia herbida]|uniref:Histone methylation protein DOT1 n=1 Tax=Actinocorallia herbida TaxID=58109 RepID=A0A3N1CN56_9ACTN|nr:hypothetical protein [Actinocorallia herbida]ROO82751.1 histone methylation protein DOT1 [Actinocorallia herbida]
MQRLTTRLGNLWWERRLGVSTRGIVAADHPDATHYATMSYTAVRRILAALELGRDDVFGDLGSGLGRVLCCAARLPVKEAVGFEVNDTLTEAALANAARLRARKAEVSVRRGPCEEADFTGITAFFLFDPFGERTLRAVLDRIEKREPRTPLRFAYANPVHARVFAECPWLEEVAFWDAAATGLEHSVRFYRTVP